ncbi:MAG: hypothetical protein LBC17_01260, partial [Lactobacillaceae bacterium]|nr:hypothetical protein [Lactobacillaceae bacterium]
IKGVVTSTKTLIVGLIKGVINNSKDVSSKAFKSIALALSFIMSIGSIKANAADNKKLKKEKVKVKPIGQYTDQDFINVMKNEYGMTSSEAKLFVELEKKLKIAYPNDSQAQIDRKFFMLISKISYGRGNGNKWYVPLMWDDADGSLESVFNGKNIVSGILSYIGYSHKDISKFKEAVNDNHSDYNKNHVDFAHLGATLNAYQTDGGFTSNLYSTFRGTNRKEAAGIVGDLTYIAGNNISIDNPDYTADLDAVNIYYRSKNSNQSISQIMTDYYAEINNNPIKRAREFKKNVDWDNIKATITSSNISTLNNPLFLIFGYPGKDEVDKTFDAIDNNKEGLK